MLCVWWGLDEKADLVSTTTVADRCMVKIMILEAKPEDDNLFVNKLVAHASISFHY